MNSRSSDEFKDEVEEAVGWYASKSSQLGARFRRAVNRAIVQVINHPKMYAKFDGEYRLNRVGKYPYGVVYRLDATEIFFSALMHLHRKPGYWKGRR